MLTYSVNTLRLSSLIITADFNLVDQDSTLPSIQQYVDYKTWNNKTLDLLYADSRNAYKAPARPLIGRSDNNLVLLRPQYVPALQRLHVAMKSVMRWIQEACEDCEVLLCTPTSTMQSGTSHMGMTSSESWIASRII